MNLRFNPTCFIFALALSILCPPLDVLAQTTSRSRRSEPVTAIIQFQRAKQTLRLHDREENTITYSMPDAPSGVFATFDMRAVRETQFDMPDQYEDVLQAASVCDWKKAAELILPHVAPLAPFLALPDNNAIEPAYRCANYLTQAARREQIRRDSIMDREVRDLLLSAQRLYAAISDAEWYPWAETSGYRVAQCLLYLGHVDRAEEHLNTLREPDIWDPSFGVYALVRGEIAFAQKEYYTALDEAVRSVAFQNKDVASFPDALLLSAAAYEETGQIYRARDVYYEVGRLFARTDWEDRARDALQRMVDSGVTAQKEQVDIETVFFGLQEDMNELVRAWLAKQATRENKQQEQEE